MKLEFDVIILGGGAAGLCCAIRAKECNRGLRVAVIEKNDRVGKKLLATGNGRCNLSNQHIDSSKYCGSFQKQSGAVLQAYPTDKVLDFFKRLGLLTYADSEGRIYPISKQASSVLDVLRFRCESDGVAFFYGETVRSVRKNGTVFSVVTADKTFVGQKLVLACGSKAAPKLGGSAAGIDIVRNFGIKTAPFSPALCPLTVDSPVIASLKGIRAAASVTLMDKQRVIATENGEVQFADNALSGICIFNLSLFAQQGNTVLLDLLSDYSEQEVFTLLMQHKSLFASLPVDALFTGILQKRLAQAVLKQSDIKDFSKTCRALTKDDIRAAAKTVKAFSFTVRDVSGFEQAQSARGGVLGFEIDESTMQSKKVKNLYLCGEIIDICGACGGFNLHFAFASGMKAGEQL